MRDGIQCPSCGCRHSETTHVYRLAAFVGGQQVVRIRRRRVCRHCGESFYSQEESEMEKQLATGHPQETTAAPQNAMPPESKIVNPFL